MAALLGRSAFVGVTPNLANAKVRFFPRDGRFPSAQVSKVLLPSPTDYPLCRSRSLLRFPQPFPFPADPFSLMYHSGTPRASPRRRRACVVGNARFRGNVIAHARGLRGGVVLRLCARRASQRVRHFRAPGGHGDCGASRVTGIVRHEKPCEDELGGQENTRAKSGARGQSCEGGC